MTLSDRHIKHKRRTIGIQAKQLLQIIGHVTKDNSGQLYGQNN